MYCFAFSKFGACTKRNCRYMHVNENAAYPNYSSKRDIPQAKSPGSHVPRQRTKGRNEKGAMNRYKPNQERVGICFKFRDTGYCKFGKKCRFKHISSFNKRQDRNLSNINQSNSFLEEMRGLVTSVKSLVESHRAGGPTMAFQGYQTQHFQPQGQFAQPVCPIITQ